jgi:hypothetical protein
MGADGHRKEERVISEMPRAIEVQLCVCAECENQTEEHPAYGHTASRPARRRRPGRINRNGAWRLTHQCRTAFYHGYMTWVEGGTRTGAATGASSFIS